MIGDGYPDSTPIRHASPRPVHGTCPQRPRDAIRARHHMLATANTNGDSHEHATPKRHARPAVVLASGVLRSPRDAIRAGHHAVTCPRCRYSDEHAIPKRHALPNVRGRSRLPRPGVTTSRKRGGGQRKHQRCDAGEQHQDPRLYRRSSARVCGFRGQDLNTGGLYLIH